MQQKLTLDGLREAKSGSSVPHFASLNAGYKTNKTASRITREAVNV